MHATEDLAEAERQMTICNACRYCEGLCAVFPALERRRDFADGDLNYLANLCHDCGACFVDCQFAPPHEFAVNVPATLAAVRTDSYRAYAWPAIFRPLFDRNGVAIAILAALGVAGFILGFVLMHDPAALFATDGQFYRLMPHHWMVVLFGGIALYVLLALTMGWCAFWRDICGPGLHPGWRAIGLAMRDAAALRNLDGGGAGCHVAEDGPKDRRRLFHHLTFYGFLLCFAATCTATVYHYLFDLPAPYPWYALPKLLGTAGGIGLLIGPPGLFLGKLARDPALGWKARLGMDSAFLGMLFLTGLTGLLLMAFRETPALGILLSVHLGVVFALFLSMPYGKFVHGLYRFGALVLNAHEARVGHAAPGQAGRPVATEDVA